ncbi:DNA replication/checkpoint protein [Aspergillus cavernicola]|uniref:DNA replication regulator SLD2 n=1 Tax=Aspergillus cavernicola TaxID=176166 RepID=A0ABR4J4R8_9EURO
MASITVSESVTHATTLRAELKEWEREFAAANEGRKAGRDDIKRAPEIAAKYKEYSRLKAHESSSKKSKSKTEKTRSTPIETPIEHDEKDHQPQKRKHPSPDGPDHTQQQTSHTPRKAAKGIFQTPSKTRTTHPSTVDPYDSPSVLRRLFSPSTHMQSSSPLKTAIGPTPQRDGKALGLFDLLSESGGSTATPSASRIASIKGMAAQTPSKKDRRKTMDTIVEEDEDEENTRRGERTPASSGKKYMLSALFATPTTLRYSALVEGEGSKGVYGNFAANQSPQSATDVEIASSETPSFLRRSTSGLYNSMNPGGDAGGLSPIPVRKPPQFVGKGLSQLVQGLRDMEEERLEDDLDMLREMEEEQGGLNADVSDSQMPTESMGRTFKKKGQKRTTRLVRMKPVVSSKPSQKSQSQSQVQSQTALTKDNNNNDDDDDDEAGESADELEAIAETQASTSRKAHDDNDPFEDATDLDSLHSISEAELDSDSDPDFDAGSKPLKRGKSFSEKMKEAIGATKAPATEKNQLEKTKQAQAQKKEEGMENKKPSTRKVNPQAHANYRSLKIRNRGSKGRNFGRFRRR